VDGRLRQPLSRAATGAFGRSRSHVGVGVGDYDTYGTYFDRRFRDGRRRRDFFRRRGAGGSAVTLATT
jgi:hypothetical protein